MLKYYILGTLCLLQYVLWSWSVKQLTIFGYRMGGLLESIGVMWANHIKHIEVQHFLKQLEAIHLKASKSGDDLLFAIMINLACLIAIAFTGVIDWTIIVGYIVALGLTGKILLRAVITQSQDQWMSHKVKEITDMLKQEEKLDEESTDNVAEGRES